MKMKKLPILLVSLLSMLTACNSNSIAGKYGFQMGKEKGTHFGIYLTLTDEFFTLPSQPEVTDKYKKCEYSFSFGSGDPEKTESIAEIIEMLQLILGEEGQEGLTLPGYYYQGDRVSRDGERELMMGFDLSFLNNILDENDEKIPVPIPEINPETIEKLVYTTYQPGRVTMYIPVGADDVFYQLYWYGTDINIDPESGLPEFCESPHGPHDVGTHPNATDVEEINKVFKENHAELATYISTLGLSSELDLTTYRDYYTLAMGLNAN